MKKQYVIVNALDYNGFKNVLFMMTIDQVSERNTWLGRENYQILEPVKTYSKRDQLAVSESGKQYKLFKDHSLKAV